MNLPPAPSTARRRVTKTRFSRIFNAIMLVLLGLGGLVTPQTGHAVVTAAITTSDSTPDVGGAAFFWTITLTNGASGVNNVVMTFPLPSGAKFANHSIAGTAAGSFSCLTPALGFQGTVVCEAPNMIASAVATITVVAQYEADMAPGIRTASARVVASGAESIANVQQNLQSSPALSLSLAATPGATAGGIINLRATVNKAGNASAINSVLQIALPTGLDFLGVYGGHEFHGTCSLVVLTNTVECAPRFISSGTSHVTVVARSSYDLPNGNLSSTATLSAVAPATVTGSPATASTAITN